MTALILINLIASAVVVGGLYLAMRLGYLAGGGRFDRTALRFELHHGSGERESTEHRRAA
jgi:hypothetical protein